jgi:hypothetical protein
VIYAFKHHLAQRRLQQPTPVIPFPKPQPTEPPVINQPPTTND